MMEMLSIYCKWHSVDSYTAEDLISYVRAFCHKRNCVRNTLLKLSEKTQQDFFFSSEGVDRGDKNRRG